MPINPTLYYPQGSAFGRQAVTGPVTGKIYISSFTGILDSVADSDGAGLLSAGWNVRPANYYINSASTEFGRG